MYISDRYRVDIEGLVVAHGDHLIALLVVLHAPNLVGQEVSLMKNREDIRRYTIYDVRRRKPLATFDNVIERQ